MRACAAGLGALSAVFLPLHCSLWAGSTCGGWGRVSAVRGEALTCPVCPVPIHG